MDVSPWIDRRFGEPVEEVLATIEAQEHRRFLKTHLPADGLPLLDEVSYIHVARDGRDTCLSYHNHGNGFTPPMLDELDPIGLAEEASEPYPRSRRTRPISSIAGSLRARARDNDGQPQISYFHFERSWWDARPTQRPAGALRRYQGRSRRLDAPGGRFPRDLGARRLWRDLVEAAGFEAMRRAGDTFSVRARALPGRRGDLLPPRRGTAAGAASSATTISHSTPPSARGFRPDAPAGWRSDPWAVEPRDPRVCAPAMCEVRRSDKAGPVRRGGITQAISSRPPAASRRERASGPTTGADSASARAASASARAASAALSASIRAASGPARTSAASKVAVGASRGGGAARARSDGTKFASSGVAQAASATSSSAADRRGTMARC